jgi:hypothetical protein
MVPGSSESICDGLLRFVRSGTVTVGIGRIGMEAWRAIGRLCLLGEVCTLETLPPESGFCRLVDGSGVTVLELALRFI